jgi:hypothetical protein
VIGFTRGPYDAIGDAGRHPLTKKTESAREWYAERIAPNCRADAAATWARGKASSARTDDPDLRAKRYADAEYHRLFINIQEPDVAADDLPLDDLTAAVAALTSAVERLRTRHSCRYALASARSIRAVRATFHDDDAGVGYCDPAW